MCNTFVTENMELKNIVSSSGIVEGTNTVSITSDLNAKITKLNVEPGSVVRKGDILCEFDKTEFQKQLNILEQKIENNSKKHEIEHNTNLRNLEYAKSQKEISLKIAQRNIDECVNKKNAASLNHDKLTAILDDLSSRISELDKQISESEETAELVSLREYLNTEYKSVTGELEKIDSTDYDNEIAKAQDSYDKIVIECDHAIKAAEDIINTDSLLTDNETILEKELLQDKIDSCTVYASGDGVVTSLSVKEGSIPKSESLMIIADNSDMVISAVVYESDILKINEGQKCEISFVANSEKKYSGKIISVAKICNDDSAEAAAYSVRISLDNADENVIIGMNVQIDIITEMRQNTIAVPYEAICTDENGNEYVYVGIKNSNKSFTIEKRSITKGIDTSYLCEISGDINPDEYIMFPTDTLSEGQTVNIKDIYSVNDYVQ